MIVSLFATLESRARKWPSLCRAPLSLGVALRILYGFLIGALLKTGTGNGMAKSVLDHVGEPCDASSATFLVIRGNLTLIP